MRKSIVIAVMVLVVVSSIASVEVKLDRARYGRVRPAASIDNVVASDHFRSIDMDILLEQMEAYDKAVQCEKAILNGHQYVTQIGFRNYQTYIITNSDLVIVVDGQWVVKYGDEVVFKGSKVIVGGQKIKVVQKLVLK